MTVVTGTTAANATATANDTAGKADGTVVEGGGAFGRVAILTAVRLGFETIRTETGDALVARC